MHIAIGIDIGGSHISCGAVDLGINQLFFHTMVREILSQTYGNESKWSQSDF